MRAVVQRVSSASIEIENQVVSSILNGILAFIGFHLEDTAKDLDIIADKILNLRIFNDSDNLMNLSLFDIEGELLIVSQFTLYGDARKGRRPSFSNAMPPDKALNFYNEFIDVCKNRYERVKHGVFQADMNISLINSGPVTILLDSSKAF
ncbi:MAG: D-aminoacyl-tRNA deacylase [Thermotogota bacterium]|nr:D-aminoacyl-tRNA deacylase [Thermotogota bacterium]